MNDVIDNKDTPEVDVEIYDVRKCFVKMEYHHTTIDLFNAGINDDKFIV